MHRDFRNPEFECIPIEDWQHIDTGEFPERYTQIKMTSGVLHVFKQALQSQRMDTNFALTCAHASADYVKTNMASKRGHTMGAVGRIFQPGQRERVWDPIVNETGNKISQCHFKGQRSVSPPMQLAYVINTQNGMRTCRTCTMCSMSAMRQIQLWRSTWAQWLVLV